MIHYSCDLCQRKLDPESDVRYVVNLEVYPAMEPRDVDDSADDRDNLQEINEILVQLDDFAEDDPCATHQLHFDLCAECRKRFVKDPLGRDALKQFDFSEN